MPEAEIFIAPENARRLAPEDLATFLAGYGVPIHAICERGSWRLVFDGATGTYADITTNVAGEATSTFIYIKTLRDVDDFRRVSTAFQKLGWTYCDSSFYESPN